MKFLLTSVSGVALMAAAGAAFAQVQDSATVSEVIVTGTRQVGVRAADSAAPIQVVGASQLLRTGTTDLGSSLSIAVPSLSVSTNGADAAAVHVLASLRGLSPNDTLVLVDGKRRHTTSNLAVDSGSIYSGSAGVDLNYIPVGSIDHIEVLTDGAAAQYGSDAIAGVVNVILKKTASGNTIDATGGQYYNGQGEAQSVFFNGGFNLNDKGFLNLTLEERTQNFTTLGLGDARFQDSTGALLPGLTGEELNVSKASNFPHENRIQGLPEYAIYNSFFNAGYHLTEEVELYGFGNYSYNTSQHFENYRDPNRLSGPNSLGETVYDVPNGFSPKEQFDETDYSITAGLRGKKYDWNWDLSTTYGSNKTMVNVLDTGNVSTYQTLQAASVTPVAYPLHTIFDGSFTATEWAGSLDVDRSFDVGLAKPLNVAFGLEGRRDTYAIGAGEPESYYGGGTQSFAGYSPGDAGSHSRTNYAGYFDVTTQPIDKLTVDVAGRYENYSDFGDTKNGKLTLRYDLSPEIAFRGTISDGFRAPSLAEEYYNGLNVGPTSVGGQFAPNSALSQAAGFSPLKPEQSVNYSGGFILHPIPKLQITLDAYYIILHDRILPGGEYEALHAHCVPNGTTPTNKGVPVTSTGSPVVLTCDSGQTAEDLIVLPSILAGLQASGVQTTGLTNVGVYSFINAINTRTAGVDITATYSSDFEEYGHVDWSLGFNMSHNQVSSNSNLPNVLYANIPTVTPAVSQTQFLNSVSESSLNTAQPRERIILQAFWTKGPWSVNLRETVYNDMSEFNDGGALLQRIGTTGITDLDVGYKVTRNIRIDAGANNLFNTLPPLTGLSSTGQPNDGSGTVYRVPYAFAPWGQNGGYYYGRVALTF